MFLQLREPSPCPRSNPSPVLIYRLDSLLVMDFLAFILLFTNIALKYYSGASLLAQWLRICLPMQGTRVRALVWEDPTCCGATGPVSHNY